MFDIARVRMEMAQITQRRAYASTHKTRCASFIVGDLVWFYAPQKKFAKTDKRKLTRPWTGPFRVLRRLSPVNYEIRMDKRQRGGELVVHVDRLKKMQLAKPEIHSDADDNLSD